MQYFETAPHLTSYKTLSGRKRFEEVQFGNFKHDHDEIMFAEGEALKKILLWDGWSSWGVIAPRFPCETQTIKIEHSKRNQHENTNLKCKCIMTNIHHQLEIKPILALNTTSFFTESFARQKYTLNNMISQLIRYHVIPLLKNLTSRAKKVVEKSVNSSLSAPQIIGFNDIADNT